MNRSEILITHQSLSVQMPNVDGYRPIQRHGGRFRFAKFVQ